MWADIELDRATEFMKQGKCKVATEHLGKGLHSIQDKYAHRNWDTGFLSGVYILNGMMIGMIQEIKLLQN